MAAKTEFALITFSHMAAKNEFALITSSQNEPGTDKRGSIAI